MTLPNWKALPVRTKRSRRRLHNLIAEEFNLDSWTELPNPIKRSKRKLFNYYATELHLEEFKELLKKDVRSTREYYIYLKENANPSSAPTLTITVKSGESNVSGASVTIGSTTKSTGGDGKTTFTLDYDDYLVEVEKSGYVDYEENIKFRANHKSFTLNIEAEPSQSGTVTVTALDGYEAEPVPLDEGIVVLATAPVDWTNPDTSTYVALAENTFDEHGTCTLLTVDLSPNIPFGTYYLCATNTGQDVQYSGTLTVNGDEEVTITLTATNEGGK